MELTTLRDWIYDVLRVRSECYFPIHRCATSHASVKR
ncbi:hypothetical protein LMG28614_06260 [Paraburkholderia ultramafica]|uniref:Uncharacterized protein n=1 Tax=Paraburkholderia ultramafica TaxID=1544867 RepID=A0A6S7BWE5_9BURK|nr:hypothetical protein LMG28614_06260 [Paraburkholderia ultramafica]